MAHSDIQEAVTHFEEEKTDEAFDELYTVINTEESFVELDEKIFSLCFEQEARGGDHWKDRYEELLTSHLKRFDTYFETHNATVFFKKKFVERHSSKIDSAFDGLEEELLNSVHLDEMFD